jgi:hypothetical protein
LSAEHCRVAFAKRNHERQKNEAFKSFEEQLNFCKLRVFLARIDERTNLSSLRPSQDVAETLNKSLRVSELVGAVVGAFCPSCGPS